MTEALHFQPLPEWSETMKSTPSEQAKAIATAHAMDADEAKPDDLPVREAWNEMRKDNPYLSTEWHPGSYSVRTVARLLVRIKELEGPGEPVAWRWRPKNVRAWVYDPSEEFRASLASDPAAELQPLYLGRPAEPTPDPDLVLAREMAWQVWDVNRCDVDEREVKAGYEDKHFVVQSALRTIKHLRDAWLEGGV